MPLMYVLNSTGSVDVSNEISKEAVTVTKSLAYSGLGIGIVFAVLVVLMVFIALMSAMLKGADKPKKAPAPKAEKPVERPVVKNEAPAPKPASAPEGVMYVTLGGKKHAVTVEEKIPQFTVTLGGKSHSVDVEPVEEGAE